VAGKHRFFTNDRTLAINIPRASNAAAGDFIFVSTIKINRVPIN
jgi:hypothetical protein